MVKKTKHATQNIRRYKNHTASAHYKISVSNDQIKANDKKRIEKSVTDRQTKKQETWQSNVDIKGRETLQ